MKVSHFKCPHCGNDLGTAVNLYLYGSPLKVCDKCKQTYVDSRYHEIAIEGIRQEDINPTKEDKKENRKGGFKAILLGLGCIALFILILYFGYIAYMLPVIGVFFLVGGICGMTKDGKKSLEKKRQELEIERQQSMLRMQDLRYVEQLRAAGYSIPSSDQNTTPDSVDSQ